MGFLVFSADVVSSIYYLLKIRFFIHERVFFFVV